MEFKDKFIAFVDILGFKNLVVAAEQRTGRSLQEIVKLQRMLGSRKERSILEEHGPVICPAARYVAKDLDFRLTQVSDCVVISAEVSPAGAINLIQQCHGAVFRLLQEGIMCRGYITRGKIRHIDDNFVGSGYQKACAKEQNISFFRRSVNERGTPFVEVDSIVSSYLEGCGDSQVVEIFSRLVIRDGAAAALFPFKLLAHSFVVGGMPGHNLDVRRERLENERMRSIIVRLLRGIKNSMHNANPRARQKAEHYTLALKEQLKVCDKTGQFLNQLSSR